MVCARIQTVLCAIKQTQGTVRRVRHDINRCLHDRLYIDRKVIRRHFIYLWCTVYFWAGITHLRYMMVGMLLTYGHQLKAVSFFCFFFIHKLMHNHLNSHFPTLKRLPVVLLCEKSFSNALSLYLQSAWHFWCVTESIKVLVAGFFIECDENLPWKFLAISKCLAVVASTVWAVGVESELDSSWSAMASSATKTAERCPRSSSD